jgi:hypothetical protein
LLTARSDAPHKAIWFQGLRSLPSATWLRAIPIAAVAAAAIAIPSDLLDNRFFGRPIAPRPIDYVILAITAGLIGLILAIRSPTTAATDSHERRTMWSGFVSFLAVGCPVCNQAVVALVGTSGALSWWAPVQPVVGMFAVALLVWTLRQRLRACEPNACPI